jgi:hypothetical protein
MVNEMPHHAPLAATISPRPDENAAATVTFTVSHAISD